MGYDQTYLMDRVQDVGFVPNFWQSQSQCFFLGHRIYKCQGMGHFMGNTFLKRQGTTYFTSLPCTFLVFEISDFDQHKRDTVVILTLRWFDSWGIVIGIYPSIC